MSQPRTVFSEEKNPRGIPKAPFITDVEEYLGGADGDVESTLRTFQDAIAKYRYMDGSLIQRRASLEEKIPDIKKTLDMVEYLQERNTGKKQDDEEEDLDEDESPQPLRTTFELNDTLYAEAELLPTNEVYLWLGANVMLSYPIPQAISLLQSKLDSATLSLTNTIEDLEFLREQLTIMEVNTARVYNWDVKRRREARLASESKEGESQGPSKDGR